MAIEVIYENGGEGIVYIHRGTLEGSRLVRDMRMHNEQIDFSILRYQIVDFRELMRVEMTTEHLRQVAEIDCEIAPRKRSDYQLAIIISSDPMYAIAKMWENYVNDPSINAKIFHQMEPARRWLEPPQVQAAMNGTERRLGLD